MCLVLLSLICIKRILQVATSMFYIRLLINYGEGGFHTGEVHLFCSATVEFLTGFALCADHLLRGQELPGSLLRVRQWLQQPAEVLQPLQLHPSGGRILGNIRETKLHGLPVCAVPRRISRVPVLAGEQWRCAVLSHHPQCKLRRLFPLWHLHASYF